MPWLNEWGLVFTADYGAPTGRTMLRREYRQILRAAGLPMMRIHDLRHTSGSLDLAAGVPLKLVQEKLRHARLSTTADVYVHVTPVARREAAAALERLLG